MAQQHFTMPIETVQVAMAPELDRQTTPQHRFRSANAVSATKGKADKPN